jgi:hypothetical protein
MLDLVNTNSIRMTLAALHHIIVRADRGYFRPAEVGYLPRKFFWYAGLILRVGARGLQ